MKFVFIVEGYTEQESLRTFLKKWLDNHPNLKSIKRVVFNPRKTGIQ
jgi:hypothetical protein